MISISEDHKTTMLELVRNYDKNNLNSIMEQASEILEVYYPQVQFQKIGKRLLDKLFSSWASKPKESFVHFWTICKLIFEYNYSNNQIDLEVSCGAIGRSAISNLPHDSRADVVVYSHDSRRPGTALISIECREPEGVDGAKQAASYARALQSTYHLFTDSIVWNAYITQPYPINGNIISDIPQWVGNKPVPQRLTKDHILPSITDERQLRDLINICHDQIHSEGIDPAKAFDELVKLFFVKVFDEQEIPDIYEFSVLEGETVSETGTHIRGLLKRAKETSRYKELFTEPGDDEFWISNKSIRIFVETFQGFSFTGNTLVGIDAKGTVYENMVGSTFRGELGQYFTPRKIVEFMVQFLDPDREDIIFDPSCGSGGFLIYVLQHVANKIRLQQQNLSPNVVERLVDQFVHNNILGTDISPRMVRSARMNMIMHGDGWSGIHRCHGLKIQSHDGLSKYVGKMNVIFSNPPFAGFETDQSILANFSTGTNEAGNIRGVNRAIIFVEQIINLLAEGGKAGIVLPRSIFENESYAFKKLRNLIYTRCEVLAVIGLPRTAFHHTDCGILGDLLFIKKTSNPRNDYGVYVSWANNVGYNTLGHEIDENDLIDILENSYNPDYMISIQRIIQEDNLNPWHYHPNAENLRNRIKDQDNLVPLSTLVSVYANRISRRNLRENSDQLLRYAEVRDFDPITGKYEYKEQTIKTLPSRATYIMDGEEVVLLPNARNSLESGRKVILAGEDLRGIILTNRFLPLIPLVNSEYLVMMLNSKFVRDQLISVCKGAGSPDFRENKLSEIMVPVPDVEDLSSIDSFMEEISDKLAIREKLEDDLKNIKLDIDESLNSLYE